MKKLFSIIFLVLIVLSGCADVADEPPVEDTSYAGTYIGYSWKGETEGVSLEEASQYIETKITLDDEGNIIDADMTFWKNIDGYWTTRQSGNAYVDVDFSVDPTMATPGDDYKAGDSMFNIYTADMMSFYAAAVSEESEVAMTIVCPVTRYQYEFKFDSDFDFNRPVSDLTIGSEYSVPTVRRSTSGLLKPSSWDEYKEKTVFDISPYSHVINDQGVFAEIDNDSTVKDFVESLGVDFVDGRPQSMEINYGYFGTGGWQGNYQAITNHLVGKNATEYTSLIDWSTTKYSDAINEGNEFGIDLVEGATKTVQNSFDGIAGATVRVSRESTSYQRALVAAGILTEEEVIIGRF